MLCFIMLLLLLSTATAIAIATAVLSLLFLPANQGLPTEKCSSEV